MAQGNRISIELLREAQLKCDYPVQIVGLIMVIALLTIPAAMAGQWVKDLKQMMMVSSILGIIFTTVGLWLSYFFNLTSGATIILVAGVTYLISLGIKQR